MVAGLGSLFLARQSLKSVDNDLSGLLRTAFGLEPQREFITRHHALFPIYELANRELPASAGLMMSEGDFSPATLIVVRINVLEVDGCMRRHIGWMVFWYGKVKVIALDTVGIL